MRKEKRILHPFIDELLNAGWEKKKIDDFYIVLKNGPERKKIALTTGKTVREWQETDKPKKKKSKKRKL